MAFPSGAPIEQNEETQNEETAQEIVDLLPILADWLGIEPERVKGFVVAIESDLGMSSAWSVNLPIWHLLAMADELKYTLQQQR